MGKRKLSKKYYDLFEERIMQRGKEYYNNHMIGSLYEYSNKYVAYVLGSNDNCYRVDINLLEDNEVDMTCTCPYEEHCKHEYATLMAIDDKEYDKIKLLDIPDEDNDVELIIKNIPKDKLVEYMCTFSKEWSENLKNQFIYIYEEYLPMKSRKYFYNTIYNDFKTKGFEEHLEHFITCARRSLLAKKYSYAFLIASAIIDAVCDVYNEEDYEDEYQYYEEILEDAYYALGIVSRISYRKGNKALKNRIKKWTDNIIQKDYCKNQYLEDMILTLKEMK